MPLVLHPISLVALLEEGAFVEDKLATPMANIVDEGAFVLGSVFIDHLALAVLPIVQPAPNVPYGTTH